MHAAQIAAHIDRLSEAKAAYAAELTPLPLSPHAAEWAHDHRSALVDFLRSPAGKALLARGRMIQHDLLVGNADRNEPNPAAARTWCECLDWIESLSRASARSTEASGNLPPGDSSEKDEATTRPGETVLRERLSP